MLKHCPQATFIIKKSVLLWKIYVKYNVVIDFISRYFFQRSRLKTFEILFFSSPTEFIMYLIHHHYFHDLLEPQHTVCAPSCLCIKETLIMYVPLYSLLNEYLNIMMLSFQLIKSYN